MVEINYIGLFLMIFIVAVIGTSLVTPVAQQVGTASVSAGITGTPSSTLISLSTLMFVLLIVVSVASLVILGMRLIGLE